MVFSAFLHVKFTYGLLFCVSIQNALSYISHSLSYNSYPQKKLRIDFLFSKSFPYICRAIPLNLQKKTQDKCILPRKPIYLTLSKDYEYRRI